MRKLNVEEMDLVAGAGDCPKSTKKGNNGLGNGDQEAPGRSLCHNQAENNEDIGTGSHENSGKPVDAN
jgi:hypothetical protein